MGTETDSGCVFYRSWRGECNDALIQEDPVPLCEDHADKTCCSCGAQATCECGVAGSLVCGAPLCDTCECPQHDATGHGSGRGIGTSTEDGDDEESDIVEELLSTEDCKRRAVGTVDSADIVVVKKPVNYPLSSEWTVRTRRQDQESNWNSETFDGSESADDYFETLVDRYELQEVEYDDA